MTPLRAAALLVFASIGWVASIGWAAPAHAQGAAQLPAVPVVASPTCAGQVSADAQVVPARTAGVDGVRVAISYDAGVYDGSCALTVTADWTNLDTGASGSEEFTAVSTIDGHYGFIGYANTTFEPGPGAVVVTLSSHPGAELRLRSDHARAASSDRISAVGFSCARR